MALPIHRLEWTIHASGVSDIDVIADSLSWLIGDKKFVDVEKTQSYHNTPMYIVHAEAKKRSDARRSLPRLGESLLDELSTSIEGRIDDGNWLHLRLKLDELVRGNPTLTNPHDLCESVKGRMKLEVYPGDVVEEVAHRLLSEAVEIATRKGLPEIPNPDEDND
jgi:RNA binding exosome subunit